jgi:hypothetical protein
LKRSSPTHQPKRDEWLEQQEQLKASLTHRKEVYKEFMGIALPQPRQPYNWIDAEWLSSWIKGENVSPPNNSAIVCQHGLVDPYKSHRLKVISSKAWEYLQAYCGEGGPTLSGSSCCQECAAKIYNSESIYTLHSCQS